MSTISHKEMIQSKFPYMDFYLLISIGLHFHMLIFIYFHFHTSILSDFRPDNGNLAQLFGDDSKSLNDLDFKYNPSNGSCLYINVF